MNSTRSLPVLHAPTDESYAEDGEQTRARLAAIVESSDDAIISKDLSGIITTWNRGAERLFGYSPSEAIGQSITMIIPQDRLDEEREILGRIRRGQPIDHYETVRRRKDGSLVDISITVSPLVDAQGRVVGASKIGRDITEIKRAKEKLEQAVADRTAKLRETLNELESYSYSISHDMRAPLRAMQAYAQVLVDELGPRLDDTHRRYLDRISAAANRLDKLITDILSYSRLARTDLDLRPVNLDTLVDEIVHQYPVLQNAGIEVASNLGVVIAAEALLTQAISNLLTNAAKFVPLGVKPTIRIWSKEVSISPTTAAVRLLIQDNGIGVAPRDQQRIFGIFARVHSEKEYEGTGIGLSIVKKAVERMGGTVGVESELGKGSTFWIQLPKA